MNFMQKTFTDNQFQQGSYHSHTPCKMSRYQSPNTFSYNSNCSSACSSTNYNNDYDSSNFNYDSEDADANNLVGQAHQYCEATRGGKKKQFSNADERFQFKQQYEAKKKTELCRNFEMYHCCKYGDSCSYAHGANQLQKKTHLPSNFMTKLCTQFHRDGTCAYGERCQYLHSVYDLKSELTYTQALKEGARLTQQRNNQISGDSYADCLWANLKTGDGCGAPKKPRLACFEQIYNKESLQENLRQIEHEETNTRVAATQVPIKMNNYQQQYQQAPQYQQPKQYQQPMMKSYSYNQNMNYGQQAQQVQYQNYQNQMYYNQYKPMEFSPMPTFKNNQFTAPQPSHIKSKFESFFTPRQSS